jgi:hypothetical protein
MLSQQKYFTELSKIRTLFEFDLSKQRYAAKHGGPIIYDIVTLSN